MMDLPTIKTNLERTIEGKKIYLAQQKSALALSYLGPVPINGSDLATVAIIQMLELNIIELEKILQDVESCNPTWTPINCPYAKAETCHRVD